MIQSEPSTDSLLLIIDMQEGFPTAGETLTIATLLEELQFAAAYQETVVSLTYQGFGKLVPALENSFSHYGSRLKLYSVEKVGTDSGASQVLELLEAENLAPTRIRVCGVNINFCVRETVENLAAALPATTLEVIACGCYCERGRDFSSFPHLDNVVVVGGEKFGYLQGGRKPDGQDGKHSPSRHRDGGDKPSLLEIMTTLLLGLLLAIATKNPFLFRLFVKDSGHEASPPVTGVRQFPTRQNKR
ncbi:MAG: hypothetical protein HY986_16685 [Candidatus Melainabacteria bacterium]|nr:hypothetical protein [Candidatus Melainabacteria bacterium]